MRIGVDGNLLCGEKTGMGTVVFNVLKYWKATNRLEVFLYVPGELESEYERLLQDNGINITNIKPYNYMIWEQIILPRKVIKDQIDVLWCPYNTAPLKCKCKIVVTIHDVIYMKARILETPSFYKKAGIVYRRFVVPKAVSKASRIIADSKYSEKEIVDLFGKARNKTKFIYYSADLMIEKLEGEKLNVFFLEHKIKKPYILGFGSLEPRKNTIGLIKAYEDLPERIRLNYQLVLFGFRGHENSQEIEYIKEHNIKGIRILDYVSDTEKNSLYAESEVFVFPTFSEGFGIPVLEAFAADTPIITSNTSSLPEVAGDAAVFVDPADKKSITRAIENLLEDAETRSDMVKKGRIQLERFSWEKTASEVLKLIKDTFLI